MTETNELGAAVGIVLEHAMRIAALALGRYPADTQATLMEALDDGATLALTVELSSPRLILKIGKLVAFELAPEIDVSRQVID